MCRTVLEEYAAPAARGMQAETPPKQAALARQVRQRMNRLCKPEHRARFCFFSKKKSPAGMRRFPIPSKIQIRMGFNRSALNPRSPKIPSPTTALHRRLRHRARRNHHRITLRHPRPSAGACATAPAETTAFAARFASPRPLELPLARLRRARAGFQSAARYSKSMPRPPHGGCKRKCRPNRRLGAASAAKDEPARQARALRALLLLF